MKKLGLRATARELGISHVALSKAESNGRVPKRIGQLFDVEACRAALEKNTNPTKSAQARKQQQTPAAPVMEPEPIQPVDGSMAEALRRKENALARLRELELAEKEGQLVTLEDVERVWDRLIAACRSRLLAVPSKIASEVAAENSPSKCCEIIRTALYDALTELAEGGLGIGDEIQGPTPGNKQGKVRR